MRTFEWLLVALVAARLLAILLRGEAGMMWRLLTAMAAGGALVAHLALEGPRWSLAPTYLATAVVLVLLAWERPHPKAVMLRMGRNRRLRRPVPWGRALLWTFLWLPTVALAWLLPVWTLPAPTGPWAVGSLSFPLNLPDAVGPDGRVETNRRTMVRMWYPVDPALALPADAPWVERADVLLPAMAASAGLPRFVFGHLRLVETHAAWAAPLAEPPAASDPATEDAIDAGWPVVSFDHGLGGFRSQNTFLTEDLASHGAVVVALDHPGDAIGTTLPDGTRIPYVGLPPSSDPGYVAAVVAMGERWTADTLALLRTLADLAPVGDLAPFAGTLDLDRLLATGHSTGGGVAVEVCHAWAGCRSVLALDPWWGPVDPERLASGSERPLVVVASDPELGYFAPTNADRFARFAAASEAAWSALVLEGGGHHDVNDTARLSPIAGRFGHNVGPADPDAATEAVRAVAAAMLDGAGPVGVAALAPPPLRVEDVGVAVATEEPEPDDDGLRGSGDAARPDRAVGRDPDEAAADDPHDALPEPEAAGDPHDALPESGAADDAARATVEDERGPVPEPGEPDLEPGRVPAPEPREPEPEPDEDAEPERDPEPEPAPESGEPDPADRDDAGAAPTGDGSGDDVDDGSALGDPREPLDQRGR